MRRWWLSVLLVLSCGDTSDDGTTAATCPPDCPGETDTSTSGITTAATDASISDTTAPATTTNDDDTTDSTTAPATGSSDTTADGSSSGGPSCDAPTDCATCWACAEAGPCMAVFETCYMSSDCTPSLTCIDSMCPDDGLQQSCVDLCCMSCTQRGTCSAVDAAITCVERQCADLCARVSCP